MDSAMPDSETTIELLRDVREILRDQARAQAAQAEATAVAHDRLTRSLDENEDMKDIIARIDASLQQSEAARSLAKANAELANQRERISLVNVADRLTAAASSTTGQKILMFMAYIIMGWLGLRFGIVQPGPSIAPTSEVPTVAAPPSAEESTSGFSEGL